MTRRVSYELDDGTRVEFETDPVDGWREVGAEEVIARLTEAVAPLVAGAAAILDQMRRVGPKAVEVTFGVKASGTANWVVAKAATEGNFEVKLTWAPGMDEGDGPVSATG